MQSKREGIEKKMGSPLPLSKVLFNCLQSMSHLVTSWIKDIFKVQLQFNRVA